MDKNVGRCSVCDAWSFTSKTEKLRHIKQVYGRTTTGASNKSTAVFTCNHEGCDRKFSSYHLLYQHKKKGHLRRKAGEDQNKNATTVNCF